MSAVIYSSLPQPGSPYLPLHEHALSVMFSVLVLRLEAFLWADNESTGELSERELEEGASGHNVDRCVVCFLC